MVQSDWFLETEHPRRVSAATIWSLAMSGAWCFIFATTSSLCQNPFQPLLAMQRILYPSVASIYLVILTMISVWASFTHSCSYSVVKSKPKSTSSIIYSMFQPQVMLSMVLSAVQGLVSSMCFVRVAWPAVSEDERFLVGAGAFTGAWIGFNYCFKSGNTLQFPVIHKERSYQIQEILSVKVLTKTMLQSLKILQYYFVGSLVLNLSLYQTLPCGLSINVALASFITTSFLLIINNTRLTLFSLFLTSSLPELSHSELLANLKSSSPLLRILTLQAISRKTKTEPAMRNFIFSLSQPGGHPTNWRTVSQSCLDILRSVFTKPSQSTRATASKPTTVIPSNSTPTIRRLGGSDLNGTKLQDISLVETPDPHLLTVTSTFDKLKSLGAISSCGKSEDLMSMISSVEILTQLVVTSLTEDKYGVVQKDLADIIATLARLENEMSSMKIQDSSVLKRSTSSGLYKIAITFGQHLDDVPLPSNVQQKMKNYVLFLQT